MARRKVVMTDPMKNTYFYDEAIKILRSNIQFAGRNIQTIVISSCYPNEGKSGIALSLAREMGNIGKKVLVLDADIRKSSFMTRYQVKTRNILKGLSQYLSGQAPLQQVLVSTNYRNVDFIFAGPSAPNPSELLEDNAFADLLQQMKLEYDYILIDTPPLCNMIDAAVVAKECDGAIMVIESGAVSYRSAARAKEQLEKSGCRILGAVLNKVDTEKEKYYRHYESYYKPYADQEQE